MDIVKELLASTDSLGGKLLAMAALLAAIGTIAMTVVEAASNLWRGQMRLHRSLFQAWVRADLTATWSRMYAWAGEGDADTPSRRTMAKSGTSIAELQFLQLACGDARHAQILFDQPTDKFAAQLQAAANVALEYPTQHEALYHFLTRPMADVPTLPARDTPDDSALWLDFSRRAATTPAGEAAAAAMKARARLGNLVARRLDVFQNAARYRWDRLRQWAASVLAGLLAIWLATQVDWQGQQALAVPLVLLAGAMAPFANDLVNRLTSFRGKG